MNPPTTPPTPKVAEEALHVLEVASAEHMDWLKRVHCSLLFRGEDHPASSRPARRPSAVEDGLAEKLPDHSGANRAAFLRLKAAREHMEAMGRELTARAARGQHVDPATYMAFMEAVQAYHSEGRAVELLLHQSLAETDPLTGLYNRRGMGRDLRREWVRATRTDSPCCLALVDIDHFKGINDCHGHQTGDHVLASLAHFLQKRLRPYDTVYRYGGEEFLCCLPNTTPRQAKRVLDRLRLLLARLPLHSRDGGRLTVTVSMGVAAMDAHETPDATIARADEALYQAKDEGRNRVVLAQEG